MNRTQKPNKKLKLTRTTIRPLTNNDLDDVRGGLPTGFSGPIHMTECCTIIKTQSATCHI